MERVQREGLKAGGIVRARNRIRTGDPFLTMEVLYQLSYPGVVERRGKATGREPGSEAEGSR